MSDTDLELLARYTRDRGDEAFAELVRRHLDLVHSAALRQVRSPQLAEEVAQSTFLKLAQHARQLAPDTIFSAWLYQVTRREAIDVVRREARRQLREQIATEMNAMNATAADWTHIEPLLDEAMHALDETDRAAVLLRYFENKSLREVGQALGASENAAQKRLTRAVEQLRGFFAKRGVSVGASGLVVVLSANAVQAAPIGLTTAVIAVAITETAVTTSTLTLIKATLKLMAWTKLKTATVTVVILLLGGGAAVVVRQMQQPKPTTRTTQRATASVPPTGWREQFMLPGLTSEERQQIAKIGCVDNLKQVAAALKSSSAAHGQTFPKDLNSLEDYLVSPMYLTCPGDESKTETAEWTSFRAGATSYVMVSPGIKNPRPNLVVLKCPVHGHVVVAEGRVFQGDYIKQQGMQITKQNTLE